MYFYTTPHPLSTTHNEIFTETGKQNPVKLLKYVKSRPNFKSASCIRTHADELIMERVGWVVAVGKE